MERPKREDFASLSDYEEQRAKYVEWALGAGGRLGAQIADLNLRLKKLEEPTQPAPPPPTTMEEDIRLHAHTMIVDRYDAATQLNILRKGTRLGASKKDHLALEVMDEWIDAVRAACAAHLLELAALPEDARAGYNWLQDWPKEA